MPTSIPPELQFQIEQGYEKYVNSRGKRISNEPLRDTEQSFADAMCEGSIVEGLSNGQEILNIIKNAGMSNATAIH